MKKTIFSLLVMLLIMVACSFAYCLYKTYTIPSTAFFSPLARFWELGAGAVCAYYLYQSSPKKLFFNPKGIPSIIIGVALAAPIFIYNESMHFPGFIAVIPVLGASLVLGLFITKQFLGNCYPTK